MNIRYSKECEGLLRRLEILPKYIEQACQNPTQIMQTDSSPPQVYLVRWLENGKIIFVHGVGHKLQKNEDSSVHFIDFEIHSVLELKDQLPSGWIHPENPMRDIFDKVVESFGVPVSCHKEMPAAKLYEGRWDGRMVRCKIKKDDFYQVSGDFNVREGYAQDVWVFSFKKYKEWFVNS